MVGGVRGTIKRSSLRGRLLEYFKANPDEYLEKFDAAHKFDADPKLVDNTARLMRARGELGPGPDLRPPVNRRAY